MRFSDSVLHFYEMAEYSFKVFLLLKMIILVAYS